MSYFTDTEIAYLREQKLGRLATITATGQPHVVPVGFQYNAETDSIDIIGYNLAKSLKFRNIKHNGCAAFVVDDVPPPWQPRGIEIRGHAQIVPEGGRELHHNDEISVEMIRIFPNRIISWGIDSDPYQPLSHGVEVPRD